MRLKCEPTSLFASKEQTQPPLDDSHTGQNVARWVEAECDKWGVTEVVGVVTTDTASNMKKMMEYLPIHFLHGDCINHVLQLNINYEVLEKPSIKNMILGEFTMVSQPIRLILVDRFVFHFIF